jgi:hypothetical protein
MDDKYTMMLSVAAVVGAIMMIISVFFTWVDVNIAGFHVFSLTGWEIFDEWRDVLDLKNAILPVLSIICGVLVMIMMGVILLDDKDKYRKLNMILGLATSILSICMMVYALVVTQKEWSFLFITIRLFDYLVLGFWITVAGSAISFLGGLIPFLMNVKENRALKKDNAFDGSGPQ